MSVVEEALTRRMIGGPEFWWNPDKMEDRWSHGLPEGGQLVDTVEFTNRLVKTFKFLKKNNRPYWTNVVQEHTALMNSIRE